MFLAFHWHNKTLHVVQLVFFRSSNPKIGDLFQWITPPRIYHPPLILWHMVADLNFFTHTSIQQLFTNSNHSFKFVYGHFPKKRKSSSKEIKLKGSFSPPLPCCSLDSHGHSTTTQPWNNHLCFRPNNSIPLDCQNTPPTPAVFVILEDQVYVPKRWSILFNLLASLCCIRPRLLYKPCMGGHRRTGVQMEFH